MPPQLASTSSSSSYDFVQPRPTTYDLSVYNTHQPSSQHCSYKDYQLNTSVSFPAASSTSSYHPQSPFLPRSSSSSGFHSTPSPIEQTQDPNYYAEAWSLLESGLVNQQDSLPKTVDEPEPSWVEGIWDLVEEGGRSSRG